MSSFCEMCENYAFFVLGVEFGEKTGILRGENSEFSLHFSEIAGRGWKVERKAGNLFVLSIFATLLENGMCMKIAKIHLIFIKNGQKVLSIQFFCLPLHRSVE